MSVIIISGFVSSISFFPCCPSNAVPTTFKPISFQSIQYINDCTVFGLSSTMTTLYNMVSYTYPFTAPIIIPRTMYFCIQKYRIKIGSIARMKNANARFNCDVYSLK